MLLERSSGSAVESGLPLVPEGSNFNFELWAAARLLRSSFLSLSAGVQWLCAASSTNANDVVAPPGLNWGVIIAKAFNVSGLRIFDFFNLMPEFDRMIAAQILEPDSVYKEDVSEV